MNDFYPYNTPYPPGYDPYEDMTDDERILFCVCQVIGFFAVIGIAALIIAAASFIF